MKPLKYIEFVKDEIYINSGENFIAESKADKIYQTLKTTISDLSSVRSSESRTEQVLSALNQLPDNEMRFIQHWLFKAIYDDDTFAYAYTDLAQMYNRRGGFIHPIKVPSKVELYELLEKEKQEEKYDFENVKKHLESLSDINSRIKYLIEIKTDYSQSDFQSKTLTSFDKQCEFEINKLKDIRDLELKSNQTYKLSQETDAKTDLIRVFKEQKSPEGKTIKYESEFFRITESISYEFNEDLGLTYDTFNDELFSNIDKFKTEINENITNLNKSDRGFYLKRILERLNKSIGTTIHKNKKTGDEYALKTDASIDRVHTFEGNELERYYRMSNIYKNQMIDFISQLIEPATKTEIMGFIDNEENISSPNKIPINKDGFPIDEKGNFVHSVDDQGNCIILLVNHENIVFSPTDKQQVHKAAKQIAEYLSKNFSFNLENEFLISVKTEKVYTVEPARLPTIGIYFDSISKTLNYLGSVYGINFEYLIYIDFKEYTNSTLIAAKTGIYNKRALKESVLYAEMWLIERDKIYLQKRELFKDSQSKSVSNETGSPLPSENKTDQEKRLTLDKVFENISKYKFIMELLANNEFIQPNTYIWKDEKRSNKATLISVLKILHKQGFYKNNKELKHYEIKDIALNTFGIGISISSIKQHKLNTAEKAVKLIPIASTVNIVY